MTAGQDQTQSDGVQVYHEAKAQLIEMSQLDTSKTYLRGDALKVLADKIAEVESIKIRQILSILALISVRGSL